jgi:hypothetical protein
MKKKLTRGTALAVLLAGAGGSLAFAGADPNGGDRNDHVRVVHVTLTDTQETDFDLGASGASVR